MITLRKATATLPDGTPISTSPYNGTTKSASPLRVKRPTGPGGTSPGKVVSTTTGTTNSTTTTTATGTGNVQSTPEGKVNFWLDDILIAIILILMAFKIYEAM